MVEIDWFTLTAQILNFLILVALLRHFLYKRIVNAMDKREERIHSRIQQAEQKKDDAEKERDEFRKKNKDFEKQKVQKTEEMHKETEKTKQELLDRARDEVDRKREQWEQALQNRKNDFIEDVKRSAAEQVCSAARHMLRDLGGRKLESVIVQTFLEKLDTMPEDEKHTFSDTLRKEGGTVTVRTSFEPDGEERRNLEDTVHNVFDGSVPLEFTVAEELVCGIDLQANGIKIAWNVADYLSGLDRRIAEELDKRARTDAEEKDSNGPE